MIRMSAFINRWMWTYKKKTSVDSTVNANMPAHSRILVGKMSLVPRYWSAMEDVRDALASLETEHMQESETL